MAKDENVGLEDSFGEMFESENEEGTVKQTIDLLTNKENIELKTEIPDPLRLSLWEGLRKYAGRKGLEKTQTIMEDLKEALLVYQVSKNRKSREEVIEALQSLEGEEEEEGDKMEQLLSRQE